MCLHRFTFCWKKNRQKGIRNAQFTRPNWFLSQFFFDRTIRHTKTWFIDCNNICHTSYNQMTLNWKQRKLVQIKSFSVECLCDDLVLFLSHFDRERKGTRRAWYVLEKMCVVWTLASSNTKHYAINKQYLFSVLSKSCHII